jgi:hydroxypyruvate reductase
MPARSSPSLATRLRRPARWSCGAAIRYRTRDRSRRAKRCSRPRAINFALIRSGAPIEEMNCVRSHLSRFKGGGLAKALHEAGVTRARALVAVDVPVGGFAAVSSGPAAADKTSCDDALALVRKYALPEKAALVHETLKPGEPADFVEHEAICDLTSPARASGLPVLEGLPVRGSMEAFAARLTGDVAASGELEIAVPKGAPPGGRDQHLALLMARKLRGKKAEFLAAGTDGRDGPTDAAGGVVDGETAKTIRENGVEPQGALDDNDAYGALSAADALLMTGPTGTNVNDLRVVLIGGHGTREPEEPQSA